MQWLQGIGVRPGGVLVYEVVDDGGLELAFEVEDVVGDADCRGDAARVVQVVERAAASEAVGHALALVVQLHGEPDHVVAGVGQPRGGNRRVHAPGHRNNYAH